MSSDQAPTQELLVHYQRLLDETTSEEAPSEYRDRSLAAFQVVLREASLITQQNFNKVVVFVAAKGADLLASSLLASKIDALDKQLEEFVKLIVSSQAINQIETIKIDFDDFGSGLMSLKENGDPEIFGRALDAIGNAGSEGVRMKLNKMHSILVKKPLALSNSNNEAFDGPLLSYVRGLLQARVTASDIAYCYDIVDFRRDLYRLIKARNSPSYDADTKSFFKLQTIVATTIRNLNEDLRDRMQTYEQILLHGILDWESSKLLILRASEVDLEHEWPILYRLGICDTEIYFKIDDTRDNTLGDK
ncbi:hypothetical protein F5B21DRAFT_500964 [Xylaria acuta]|nr:hypothetical protein F5B21DRAFT_500964 [Xylaria acuta]